MQTLIPAHGSPAPVRPWMWLLGIVAAATFLAACSSAPSIPSKPMPRGVSYTGKWYSPQYENMILKQQSDGTVKGKFSYKNGGTLFGKLEGNVLHFDWIQPGDFDVARREVRGKGYFSINDDGATFSGRWGYDDDNTGGGAWDGERVVEEKNTPIRDDEPIF